MTATGPSRPSSRPNRPAAKTEKPATPAKPSAEPANKPAPAARKPDPPRPTGATLTAPLPPSTGAVATPGGGVPVQRIRRGRLTVTRLDPWTVMRMSFLLSLAVAVITVVAVVLLWGLLSAAGVFSSVEGTIDDIVGAGGVSITQYFGLGRILSYSLIVGVIDVVLITALATVGAFLYNLAANLVGGVEITVTEEP